MREQWRPSVSNFVDLASVVLRVDPATLRSLPRLTLAESALVAPFASFGGVDAYPTLVEQAAVLIEHLARNHPLPDGNKRTAFLSMVLFLDRNGLSWREQDADDDVGIIERIAAGDAATDEIVEWIRRRSCPRTPSDGT